jgi:hypothetical protein
MRTRWAVFVAAACVVAAVAAVAYAAGQVGAAKMLTADVVRTKRVEVVDERGKVRAELRTMADGSPALLLGGTDDGGRVYLTVTADGVPRLRLADKDGKPRADLDVSEDGSPGLALEDKDGRRANLVVTRDEAALGIVDGDGTLRAALSVSEGSPLLVVKDKEGKLRAVLGSTTPQAIRMRVKGESAEFSLVLLDKEGKVLWQAP